MTGTLKILKKEISDHFSSSRIAIIIFLVATIGFSMSYSSVIGIIQNYKRTLGESLFLKLFTTQQGSIPSFQGFLAYFGPLIGFILVFDAINREETNGTLGLLLSQPIHRDALINGKFGAVVTTLSFLLVSVFTLMISIGITQLGAFPTNEEILRIISFLFISIIYLSTWASAGILFSILFEREGTSALASITVWLFFTIFVYMIPGINLSAGMSSAGFWFSPSTIYTQASSVMLYPTLRILGPISYEEISSMLPTPLPFTESVLLIWPHLTYLTATMLILFIVSYVKFMRREIRST